MTTTRRRSSAGSAAASGGGGGGNSTPTSSPVRSSRRRASLLVRRESDTLDLGLLGRASPGGAIGGGGGSDTPRSSRSGGSAFRFFDDEDDEGGVLVLGGWRLRPMHVLGSVFLLGLFSILTLLTLYPGVSEGLSKDLSFSGPQRLGFQGNTSFEELAALSSPGVLAAIEDAVERRLREFEAEKEELRGGYADLQHLVHELMAESGGSHRGVGAGEEDVDRRAFLGEVDGLRAQVQGLRERVEEALKQQQQGQGQEGAVLLQGVDVAGTAAAVAELQARVEAWEAAEAQRLAAAASQSRSAQGQEGGGAAMAAACQEKLGALESKVATLAEAVGDVWQEKGEMRGMLAEVKELVEQGEAQLLVEEARGIRAAVHGEVGALKQEVLALASASAAGNNGSAAVGEQGGSVGDLGALRAAVTQAVEAARAQLGVKEAVEQQLAEAQAVLARLQEAAATVMVGKGDGDGEGEEEEEGDGRLGELEAELVEVRDEAAALEQKLEEQEARMAAAVEEIKAAVAAQQEAAQAQQQQAEAASSRLAPEELEALVAAEVAKHLEGIQAASSSAAAAAAAAAAASAAASGGAEVAVDEAGVKALVQEEVRRQYKGAVEAETGWAATDYASAAQGAKVLPKLSSATYTPQGQWFPSDWYERLGYAGSVAPRAVVIATGALSRKRVGECWPMQGRSGRFTVQLSEAVVPEAVVLEHIATALSRVPGSAPRRFAVFGRASPHDAGDPVKLHSAEYLTYDIEAAESPGGAVQRFALDYRGPPVSVVTLEVVDNWGHEPFTCLYRFRVLAPAAGVGE